MKKSIYLMITMIILSISILGCSTAGQLAAVAVIAPGIEVARPFLITTITAKIKVVDQDGNPMPNTKVNIYFKGEDERFGVMHTDTNANIYYVGQACYGITFCVKLPGYYHTYLEREIPYKRGRIKFYNLNETLVVYKIKKQVPLWYSEMSTYELEKDKIITQDSTHKMGYDLLKGDWVPPNGKGEIADIKVYGTHIIYYEVHINMEFPNPGDGIMDAPLSESGQVSPYDAPESGYLPNHTIQVAKGVKFFRIRTKNGKGGFYGKTCEKKLSYLKYYINPEEGDRNLEPDGRRISAVGGPFRKLERGANCQLFLKIINEKGEPIQGVKGSIECIPGKDFPWEGKHEFKTNQQGIMENPYGGFAFDKMKISIYEGTHNYKDELMIQYPDTLRYDTTGKQVWKPWIDTITIAPCPKRKTISLKELSYQLRIAPVENFKLPIDLKLGEPTRPYGKGRYADCYIVYKREPAHDTGINYSLKLEFASKDDGIQPYFLDSYIHPISHKKYPNIYTIPDTGYRNNPTISIKKPYINKFMDARFGDRHFIRFRTQRDKKTGKITSAEYGILAYLGVEFYSYNATLGYYLHLNPECENNIEDLECHKSFIYRNFTKRDVYIPY